MKFDLLFAYSKDQPKVTIGTLEISDGVYTWSYSDECYDYKFNPFFYNVPGLSRGEIHTSDRLFEWFAGRIPPRSRRDWLDRMGLSEYDEMEVLMRGGLRLRADTYELVKAGE